MFSAKQRITLVGVDNDFLDSAYSTEILYLDNISVG